MIRRIRGKINFIKKSAKLPIFATYLIECVNIFISIRFILIFCTLVINLKNLSAQSLPDSLQDVQQEIERIIEDGITDEVSEADFTLAVEYLNELSRNPLNINTATPAELNLLPGITPILINNLQKHIEQNGKLLTIYELQSVAGFTKEIFQLIKPFISTQSARKYDIRTKNEATKIPSLREISMQDKFELYQRIGRVVEQQEGYLLQNDTATASPRSYYVGSPWKSYTRIRYRYRQNISACLIGEKDAGERFTFQKQPGYDYISGHLFIRDIGNLKRLVLGDYTFQVGQGLVFSRGLGFGKSADAILTVKQMQVGIVPYTSVNENRFLRGVAATYSVGKFNLTALLSFNKQDATVRQDTLTIEPEVVENVRVGGYHRTQSEIQAKNTIGEKMIGTRMEYQKQRLTIGTTHHLAHYSIPIQPDSQAYNRFSFRGVNNRVNGLDFDWTVKNINFFGELARSAAGGYAGVFGALASLDPKIDIALQMRLFTPNFRNPYAFTFAESPTNVRNERGIYLGIKLLPNPKWTITAFLDQFYFDWYKYQINDPSRGYEFLAQIMHNPNKKMYIYLRYRIDNKQRNITQPDEPPTLEMLGNISREAIRLEWSYQLNPALRLKTRAEKSIYRTANQPAEYGFLLYQDILWRIAKPLRIVARYALFNTPSYNSRIYAYENDFPTLYTIPPYYGENGTRYYLMLNLKAMKNLDIWFKISQTTLQFAETIGSALDIIQGNQKTEFRIQLKYTF